MRLIKMKNILRLADEKKALIKERIFKGEIMLEANKARLTAIEIIIANYNKLLKYELDGEKDEQ